MTNRKMQETKKRIRLDDDDEIMESRKTILITGMAGGLANLVASKLNPHYEIIGVDFRPYRGIWPYYGKFFQVDYTKRILADIFRQYQFHAVMHLGRIGSTRESFYKRYNLNVLGTSNILHLCEKYEVQAVLIFSTFHVYGAHQHNSTNIEEDHPLRAGQIFPELIDAVELDNLATSYLWKNRSIRTVVLRPCNVIGSNINNTITTFLRRKYIPRLMGFDPMQQFIHEEDAANAIILAVENENVYGVYNVTGAGSLPFTQAIHFARGKAIPIPHFFAYPLVNNLALLGLGFPAHLLDYFRYPTIIADKKFRDVSGYTPQMGLCQTFEKIGQEN